MAAEAPRVIRLKGPFGYALTVDVEEWYHTCLVPDYVRPEDRPPLPEELDWLLPELLAMLAEARLLGDLLRARRGGRAAPPADPRDRRRRPRGGEPRLRPSAGLRALREGLPGRRRALQGDPGGPPRRAGARLPGAGVVPAQPRQRAAADGGRGGVPLRQLAHPLPARRPAGNPRFASRLRWDGIGPQPDLLELPPLTFGGPLRLPAGSWTGRLVNPDRLVRAALDHAGRRRPAGRRGPPLGDLGPADSGPL